jgi:hypothetical protein
MIAQIKKYNPLVVISDEQWIKLITLLTENVFILNRRELIKAELQYNDSGHYPAIYFRLTTILDNPDDDDLKTEVSGFVIGFNNDWDDDVYIHPLGPQGYWEDWLDKNGITAKFAYHEVGLRKLYAFLEKVLKLWEITEDAVVMSYIPNEWRELLLPA